MVAALESTLQSAWSFISTRFEADVALGTFILALATVALAGVTWRATGTTKRAVDLQAAEVELFRRQLELAEAQAQDARRAAAPKLRALVRAGDKYDTVQLIWAYGGGPAYEIEVWTRSHRGLRVARHDFMTAQDGQVEVYGLDATAEDVHFLPFDVMARPSPSTTVSWVGVAWRGPDGSYDGWSEQVERRSPQATDYGLVTDSDPRPYVRTPGPAPIDTKDRRPGAANSDPPAG